MSYSNTETFEGNPEADTSASKVKLPTGVIPLYGFDTPPPRRWRVEDLIPDGHMTMLIGDGGTGKSYLALHLALCIASGQPFLGQEVVQGRVLYIDYELDAEDQMRRTLRVANGLHLDVKESVLDGNLFYFNPETALGTEEKEAEVQQTLEAFNVAMDVVIIDSLTVGSTGDMKDQVDFNQVFREIRNWSTTTLAIDHVSKAEAARQSTNSRAFGSVFKRNTARSSLTLTKKDDCYILNQEKSNFSGGGPAVAYTMEFGEKDVVFEPTTLPQSPSTLSTREVTLKAIEDIFQSTADFVSPEEIRKWREDEEAGVSLSSVRRHMKELDDEGHVTREHGEGAKPVTDEAR